MKIIKPSVEIISPINGQDILAHIERCGRVCYKSEGKITEGSAERFVRNIIKSGHESVLEHGTFIFQLSQNAKDDLRARILELAYEGFECLLRFTKDGRHVVSGNVRAWRDFFKFCLAFYKNLPGYVAEFVHKNPILFPEFQNVYFLTAYSAVEMKPLQKTDLCTEKEKLVHFDFTTLFVCDRGVSHEIVRHRKSGYSQESTRYCNYSRDDFGGEITVIHPYFLEPDTEAWFMWENACAYAEASYFDMLTQGCTAQEARDVLPHSVKTELVKTTNLMWYRHFLKLRTGTGAHPQMREVATMLLEQVREKIPVVFDDI